MWQKILSPFHEEGSSHHSNSHGHPFPRRTIILNVCIVFVVAVHGLAGDINPSVKRCLSRETQSIERGLPALRSFADASSGNGPPRASMPSRRTCSMLLIAFPGGDITRTPNVAACAADELTKQVLLASARRLEYDCAHSRHTR